MRPFWLTRCRALCVVFLPCVDFAPSATHATASMAQVKVSVPSEKCGAGCLSIVMAVSVASDRIAGLESVTNLQSHAEFQHEQTHLAEFVIQQLRTAGTPTNPPPPTRGTSQKQVTEGGATQPTKNHRYSKNHRCGFLAKTYKFVCVVLETSMYFSGTRNDSSFGE